MYLGATPSFHRLLSRPVTLGDPSGIPWIPSEDPLGTPGGPLGTPCGPSGIPWGSPGGLRACLGVPLGSLGDPLGIPRGPLRNSFGDFGPSRARLGDSLGATWSSKELSWSPKGTPGGLLGASWDHFGASKLKNAPLSGQLLCDLRKKYVGTCFSSIFTLHP